MSMAGLYGQQIVPRFSLAERDRRWETVRRKMAEAEIDVIIVPPNTGLFDWYQANVRYLTGIGGNCCLAAAIFPLEGEPTAITSPDVDVSFWLGSQDWVTDIRPVSSGWGYAQQIIGRIRETPLRHKRIGISGLAGNTRFPEGIVSHGFVEQIRGAFPDVELVNANLLMERARFVKSAEEIEFIERSVGLVSRAVDVLVAEARPSVPENAVYARMLMKMVEEGGEIPTLLLWSAGHPQPPSNHYMPTRRPLEKGDIISFEIEARWAGYRGQNTWQAVLGKVDAAYREMFDRQQLAVATCYDLLRPGNRVGQLSDACEALSDDKYDCRIILHGMGLGDDSPLCVYQPRDEIMRDWVVEPNSVFIIKPVITDRDGGRRVYWGDSVVATDAGARRLGTRKPEIIEIA
jgi:Xaa-Pro aminopeptidase